MKFNQILLTLMLAILASVSTYYFMPAHQHKQQEMKHESTYGRVMRTKTLRCGYAVYPPYLKKDANTGEMSGIYYDYIEKLGEVLDIKINWTEEVSYGDMPAALDAGRFDAFCNFTWPTATRARIIDFSQPIFYDYLIVLARADDPRFDNDLAALNNNAITISVLEGATPETAARKDFPKARISAIPQFADLAQQYVNVVDKKADVVIVAAVAGYEFIKKNPGQLRVVQLARPYRIYGNSFAFARGQDEFRRMIDIATSDLLNNGVIDDIIRKYEPALGTFLRLNSGYKE